MNIDRSILKTSALDKTTKLLLHTLADYCDPSGECYPGQQEIANAMSTCTRTVQRCLRICVELGLVSVRRRWRRSNIYKVKCLVKRSLSTMTTRVSEENKPPYFNKNGSSKNVFKKIPKAEWRLCFQDAQEILGKAVAKKNRGWLSILIRTCGVDTFLESLRWTRSMILEGEASGSPITSPGGLQWWYLQKYCGIEV